MRTVIALLAALSTCGAPAPDRGPGCITIWDETSTPRFGPGVVDFQRVSSAYGQWVLLSTSGVFAYGATDDSAAYSAPHCV